MPGLLRSSLAMLLGLLVFAVGCEAVFQALPVSTAAATGYHIDPMIIGYPAHRQIAMATGWDLRNAQTLRTNNLGFVSDIDFVPDPRAVVLIGDSYVEGSMLAPDQRLGAQLQRLLGPDRPVYAMGTPGAALLDHAERIRFASQRLGVRDFVVFIAEGDIHQSLCTSSPACLDPQTLAPGGGRQPQASAIKQLLRESAFAQYLFSQLRISLDRVWPALVALPRSVLPVLNAPSPASPAPTTPDRALAPQRVDLVSQTFLDRVRPHLSGRLVLVLMGPQPGHEATAAHRESRRFGEIAAAQGATVVDLTATFQTHAAQSPLSLHVGPYDHHLNGLGMRLVAGAAAAALQTSPPPPGAAAR